jgi:hypothetical protein
VDWKESPLTSKDVNFTQPFSLKIVYDTDFERKKEKKLVIKF